MYFSALRNSIRNVEEKKFYDIAIYYLDSLGFHGLAVVDGPGDGGVDVIGDNEDLRIQLSVRKDWENKINEEAANALKAGKQHFIYVTNKPISPQAEQQFSSEKYKLKGKIVVSIHDLNKISTALALPGRISRSYEMLGMHPDPIVTATPKEIAISTVLLFDTDAKELRENIIEASVRAVLLKYPGISEAKVEADVGSLFSGVGIQRMVKSACSRLRTDGRIVSERGALRLAANECAKMRAAEEEHLLGMQADLNELMKKTGLKKVDAQSLLNKAFDLIIREKDFDSSGPLAEEFKNFIAEKRLYEKREGIYECLSRMTSIRRFQYGKTVDQIFSTNTFDIYRALGQRTKITMVLDASVAMPLIFGLEFAHARSRYGAAASALQRMCADNNIKLMVPRAYINEMAAHGREAVSLSSIHPELPKEAKVALRSSGNAYLSHFSHIGDTIKSQGEDLSLLEFLEHFGLKLGRSLPSVENRIISILESHGIICAPTGRVQRTIRDQIADAKPMEPKVIIDHDAEVCTFVHDNSDNGYIFATWDKVLVDVVESLARVYADTPARIIDFLSMVSGSDYEADQSNELMSLLLHIDESAASRLSQKIEKIKSTDQAYKLRRFAEEARRQKGDAWQLKPEDVARFLDGSVPETDRRA